MKVRQISLFLENKKGRLYEALSILARAGINIRALAIADTSEFGILRLIVKDPEKAKSALEAEGFTAKITPVLAVEVEDRPGGLAEILKILYEADLNVEYVYAFVEKSGEKAVVVLRTNNLEKTIDVLKAKGVTLLSEEKVATL